MDISNNKYAYFASGCFWGTEYWFSKKEGVLSVTSGFSGGNKLKPTYSEVSSGITGHLECIKVEYDSSVITYEDLVKLFFETHDFTQKNGQGPDIGSQYLSAIFYQDDFEKDMAKKYIDILKNKGLNIATSLKVMDVFWPAEDYHQNYYIKKGTKPYCHNYNKLFG